MGTVATNLVPISMALSDFVQGGGLISDKAVEVLAIQFRAFDYEGRSNKVIVPVLTVWMQLGILEPDTLRRTNEEPVEQYFTTGGNADEVIIAGSLTQVLPNGKSAFTRGSNWEIFLSSLAKPLVTSKVPPMPEDFLKPGDLGALLGTKFHLIRQDPPPRPGLDEREQKDQRGFPKKVVVARQLYAGPWARGVTSGVVGAVAPGPVAVPAAAPVAAAPAAQGGTPPWQEQSAPAVNGGGDVGALALESVRNALRVNAMYNSVDQLKLFVFQGLQKNRVDVRNAVANLISPEWLLANGIKVGPPDAQGAQIVSATPN